MNIPLSNRLQACCSFIAPGDRLADIGCDHGYLGIHLLLLGTASHVYAADIHQQPLDSAVKNAHKFGVADRMQFYLSDGARNIPRDFDVLICAGMGADTIISILNGAPWLKSEKYRLILQCQSRRPELRKYLYEQGYFIEAETLAEDGRFLYPVMSVRHCPSQMLTPGGCHISPALMASGSPLLPDFYQRVITGLESTVQGLSRTGGEKYEHFKAVLDELLDCKEAIYGNRS